MEFIARTVLALLFSMLMIDGQSVVEEWTKTFHVNKSALASTGINKYFPLIPGKVLEFHGGDTVLIVTITHDTENVDGVVTRVVEERELEDGKVIEVSRNFFAIDPKSKNVYYFGEDVDMYRNGKIVNHEGAWRSGLNGAKFGLFMPGTPRNGFGYYQEIAPGVAMDRAKVVSIRLKVETPAGSYEHCLKTEETTPLEPHAKEYKYFAPGVGLIQDADLKLVKQSINLRKE